MKKIMTFLIALLNINSIYANVIFPSFYMLAQINEIFSFYFIVAAMLILEFIVFCWLLPKKPRLVIATVTILMNSASAFFGMIFQLGADFALYAPFEFLGLHTIEKTIINVFYPIWFTFTTAAINTLIEFPIAWFFFGKINAKKLVWYIFIINLLSTALGTVSILIYQFMYGPIRIQF